MGGLHVPDPGDTGDIHAHPERAGGKEQADAPDPVIGSHALQEDFEAIPVPEGVVEGKVLLQLGELFEHGLQEQEGLAHETKVIEKQHRPGQTLAFLNELAKERNHLAADPVPGANGEGDVGPGGILADVVEGRGWPGKPLPDLLDNGAGGGGGEGHDLAGKEVVDAGEGALLRAKVVPPLDDCVDLVKDEPNTARLEGAQELLGLWLEARRREKLLGGGKEHLDVLGGLVPSLHSHLGEVNGADDVVSEKVHLVLDDGDQGQMTGTM